MSTGAPALRLVLLPGMDGTGALFRPFLDALPADIETHVVSYPRDELLEYADLLPLVGDVAPSSEPYVLVAESYSGPAAIEFAGTGPSCLRALVLCASFASNPLPALTRWLGRLARPALFRVPMPRAVVRRLLVGMDCPDELVDDVRSAIESVSPAVLTHRMRQILGVNAAPTLSALSVPVLYVAGSSDRLVGKRGLGQIAAHAPGLSSVVLDGPHLLLQVRPEEAAREIVEFARSAETSGGVKRARGARPSRRT